VFLKIEKISKAFGERVLFNELSLELEKGKVYTLMGANGSGKTTLFNIITGFVRANSGNVLFDNVNLGLLPPYKINRLGISRTFQDLRIINNLSLRENILLALEKKMFQFTTSGDENTTLEILGRICLNEQKDRIGNDLSFGQKKLLALGCCLCNNPKLILLDEPISGIDKENRKNITKIILELKNEGISILQIEHNKEYIQSTSDYVLLLKNMKLYQTGTDINNVTIN
jgi:ABC-type branched-subunit amino acid transport system ATPase component